MLTRLDPGPGLAFVFVCGVLGLGFGLVSWSRSSTRTLLFSTQNADPGRGAPALESSLDPSTHVAHILGENVSLFKDVL